MSVLENIMINELGYFVPLTLFYSYKINAETMHFIEYFFQDEHRELQNLL